MTHDPRKPEHQGDVPSDTESLVGETAASDELTDRTRVQPSDAEARKQTDMQTNPPTTTTGKVTSPAFGSAVSGGALADPGPERS
jgi:hypothetical protein